MFIGCFILLFLVCLCTSSVVIAMDHKVHDEQTNGKQHKDIHDEDINKFDHEEFSVTGCYKPLNAACKVDGDCGEYNGHQLLCKNLIMKHANLGEVGKEQKKFSDTRKINTAQQIKETTYKCTCPFGKDCEKSSEEEFSGHLEECSASKQCLPGGHGKFHENTYSKCQQRLFCLPEKTKHKTEKKEHSVCHTCDSCYEKILKEQGQLMLDCSKACKGIESSNLPDLTKLLASTNDKSKQLKTKLVNKKTDSKERSISRKFNNGSKTNVQLIDVALLLNLGFLVLL